MCVSLLDAMFIPKPTETPDYTPSPSGEMSRPLVLSRLVQIVTRRRDKKVDDGVVALYKYTENNEVECNVHCYFIDAMT